MTAEHFIGNIEKFILNPLIGLLIAIAVVYFLWAIVSYVASQGKDREKMVNHVMWGIIGLSVMLGAIGITNLLINIIKSDFGG